MSASLESLLVANRGEIACRIFATARAMGIRTIAVFSDADAKAKHVREADEAVHIGAAPASESYLRGDKVLAAQLSAHLRTTEQVFLLAQHEPQSGALAGELARGLMDSHRVYAAAAERAGRPQLAHALREMEPVLLELATAPEHTVDALLQQAITDADLPFKARSAAWAVQQTQSPAPRPRG